MNGAIASGDAIMVSSIPGVGVKATNEGMIVGYALESFEKGDIGMIEVFVQPGYWMPAQNNAKNLTADVATQSGAQHQGFAFIEMEGTSVHVSYPSILAYPVPQVTALTHVKGDWWLDKITDEGFDIVLETKQDVDIRFAWQVNPAQVGTLQYHSDGTYGEIDPLTGKLIVIEEDPIEEPVDDPAIDQIEEPIVPEVVVEEVVE
ncbi:MAG: hypothetical protein H6759_05260 [Candidatus Nomurabacteria bacterium]|nr:MAG: hypothetical protein H6759_05260 [Candidatus Nomurabacteria bacterium]